MKDLLTEELYRPTLAKQSKRIFAFIIDHGLTTSFYLFLLYIFGSHEADEMGYVISEGSSIFLLFYLIFWFLTFPLAEALAGQTIGKALMRIKISNENFKKAGFHQCIIRHICSPIDFLFFGLVGIFSVNFSNKMQRVGDKIAGTIVINA